MGISLLIRQPDGGQSRVDFDKRRISIGSGPFCDVVVTDAGVHEEQAILLDRGGEIELFDIGENSGVLVKGQPTRHARIETGAEIWIGKTVLLLAEDRSEGVSLNESVSTVREELVTPEQTPAVSTIREPEIDAASAGSGHRISLIQEFRRLINSIGTDTDIFESILDTLFHSVPVRRGFIALGNRSQSINVKAHRSREQSAEAGEAIEVSRTLVSRVLETGKAVLTSDAEADASFNAAQSIHRLRIRAAICVPLTVDGKVIGLLYGDNRERPGSLTREHLSILSTLASVAAIAVEKFRLLGEFNEKQKMEQALAIAQSIQNNFLPGSSPKLDWLDVYGRSDSADETGGDYFDFLPGPDGSLRVVIADVTGHGIGPALLMATVRAALRALAVGEASLEKLIGSLNNLICDDVRDGRFITLFFGRFEREACRLFHVGAGHTPPVHYRAQDHSTHLLLSKGPPLGILKDQDFAGGVEVPLASGDLLLFTTDGIIEAENPDGELFGLDRLRSVVAEHSGRGARELVEAVIEAVHVFSGGAALRDDATLVAVRVR